MPNTKKRNFEGVPASACWGIENYKELFGLGSDKEALSAAFDAGINDHKTNLLFGSSSIVSRTLDHWRELLDYAFKLIETLRAELFKSLAETQKALGEKERAESELIHAKLKMDQMRATAAQDAFHQADQQYIMRKAKERIASLLLSGSPGKNQMDRLKARKTPLHRTGLTLSPSLVVNRAPRAHALRSAGRCIEATDSGALHRSTAMRRRDKTLQLLNDFVARAGPVHLPSVACPPESDTKAHNDYKAKVCVCVCVCVRAQSRPHAGVGAQVILASADSFLKAGMLDSIVHYSSVYDAAMRRHRKEVQSRSKSTYAKIMAAVTLRATGGTIRGLAAFHRLERKSSGCVSAVATVGEAGEGSEIVCGHVKGDLDIYITQDGHGMSLRKVLEAEILNYEQGDRPRLGRLM